MKCPHCKTLHHPSEVADADGYCPECEQPIDLECDVCGDDSAKFYEAYGCLCREHGPNRYNTSI